MTLPALGSGGILSRVRNFRALIFLLAGLTGVANAAPLPPRLGAGDKFPEQGTLECRAADYGDGTPPPLEVPPTLRIDYAPGWVKVTMGERVFLRKVEKSDYENGAYGPPSHDSFYWAGPKSWGGDIKRFGWTVNVATGPTLRGWTWFTLDEHRVDWHGFCEIAGSEAQALGTDR